MRKTATTSGAFWTRSHHLDRMTFRELVVAYFQHYAIVTYLALTGAAIDREGEVDLVIGGTRRMRAKLDDDCPTLDFYRGFYLKPTPDGQLCAGRDALRSRSGAYCAITRFRMLVPKKAKK